MENFILNNQGIHNFSEGCLDAYFRVNTDKTVKIHDGILCIGNKVFVFSFSKSQLDFLKEKQKEGVIYSIPQLPLEKGSKFVEVCYSLEKVFAPASYENAKKRYKHLKYPFVWLEKESIMKASITEENYNLAVVLHDKWVKYKMSDEKTFKIMFPTGRYKRCCEYALGKNPSIKSLGLVKREKIVDPLYHSYLFIRDHEAVACRILSSRGGIAYDLAFFCNTWDKNLSQLANYVQIVTLRDLADKGISVVNCGSSLNKNLKSFKQSIPSYLVTHYMYGKVSLGS